MKNFKYIFFASALLFFTNCNDPEDVDLNPIIDPDPLPELTAGSADFSNYVALGNSLTAGFTDGALFQASQENSLPNILSQKFALVGGCDFTQPLTSDNFGGLAAGGERIQESKTCFWWCWTSFFRSLIGNVTVTTDIVLNNPTGPFNNLGVPGAKSFHLVGARIWKFGQFGSRSCQSLFRENDRYDTKCKCFGVGGRIKHLVSFLYGLVNNDVLGYATTVEMVRILLLRFQEPLVLVLTGVMEH